MAEEQEENRQKRTRIVTKYTLINVGLETLIQILKSYVIGTKNGEVPIDYKQVASISGLSSYLVSGCNKFFVENSMLEFKKRGLYVPTQEIVSFSRNLPWDAESAKKSLRNILEKTWFGDLLIKKFELQSYYKEADLINSLGKEAEAIGDQTASLKRLIDLLEYAEVIQKKEDTDEYILVREAIPTPSITKPVFEIKTESETRRPETDNYYAKTNYQINFNIAVPEKITDEYVQSLKNLLKQLRNLTDKDDI